MKKCIWLALVAVGLCAGGGAAFGAEARIVDSAKTAAAEWLALVDAGKYIESWDRMSPAFKKKVSKRKWSSTVADIRKPLGALSARALKTVEHTKELPGAPEGEYTVLGYEAAFERKPRATEKLTLILGQDLNWRVASYAVK